MNMENRSLARRKELVIELLSQLQKVYAEIEMTSTEVQKNSGAFYEEAFCEMKEEFDSIMSQYHKNIDRIRDINHEITSSINSWYEFFKDEKMTGKLTFPIHYFFKKRSLTKKIAHLNEEISSLTINNRFIKENLTALEGQLEIKAVSLAKSGGNFLEFEKIIEKQKSVEAELKYLLPTISGTCPADISSNGIGRLISMLS